jgi:hypothetical protein
MIALLERFQPSPEAVRADVVLPAILPGRKTTRPLWFLRRRLTIASFIVYLSSALWMLYGLGFSIGDALSRSANARAIWFARRPTLTSMGFGWMPGPVLFQSIFTVVLEPIGQAQLSGPLATSVLGAATVYVLVSICARRGLSATWTLLLVSAYAFNPAIVFTAANGMSEQMNFFFLVLLVDGFLRWSDHPSVGAATLIGVALAGCMAVRYETLVLVPVVAIFVGLRRKSWRERLQSAVLVSIPPAYVFFMWILANKLIQKSWFWFLHPSGSTSASALGLPPPDAIFLPAERTLRTAIEFSFSRTWDMSWAILVVAPILLFRRRGQRLASVGIVAIAGVYPLWIWYLLPQNRTWGNPRYFLPMMAVVVVAIIWLASDRRSRVFGSSRWGGAARAALLGVMVIAAVNASLAESRVKVAAVESEWYVFQTALGQPLSGDRVDNAERWRRTAAAVDAEIGKQPKSLVMIAFGRAFPLFLFSDHPKRFMIDSDRDYEATLASNGKNIDYVFLTNGTSSALGRLVGSGWSEAVKTETGSLWRRDASAANPVTT